MTITKQTVADQIAAYLHHKITAAQLVDWAERAMMDGEFAERDAATISTVVARVGVAECPSAAVHFLIFDFRFFI